MCRVKMRLLGLETGKKRYTITEESYATFTLLKPEWFCISFSTQFFQDL
jgi:hypothetical protein